MLAIRIGAVTKIPRALQPVHAFKSTGRTFRKHIMSALPRAIAMVISTAVAICRASLTHRFGRMPANPAAVAGIFGTLQSIIRTDRSSSPRRMRANTIHHRIVSTFILIIAIAPMGGRIANGPGSAI